MPSATETGHPRETGLLPVLKRTFKEFSQDNGTDYAAALTYYGVLSLFPALIALVGVVGLVFEPKQVTDALTQAVGQIGPTSAVQTFQGPIEQVTSGSGKSGIAAIVGIVLALSSASAYVGAFMRVSNVAYEVDEGRPFWKARPLQMLVTLVCLLLIAVSALAVVVSGPLLDAVGSAVGLSDSFVSVFAIAKWPVVLLLVAVVISILYYASPNAKLRGFKFITVGGVFALVVFLVASLLFAFYVANFGSYDKTYGALGGVVTFLVWLWITNIALILGQQLNSERERSKEIAAGVPGAEEELKLDERDAPKPGKRPKTA